jgi:hypothetical protein
MSRSRRVVSLSVAVVVIGVMAALGVLYLDPARAAVGPLPAEGLSLPADARFVVGFEVKRLVDSPFYKKYSKQGARPEAFSELEAKTGIVPERDLEQVFVVGREGNADSGLAMVLGRFDRTKLMQAVEAKKDRVTWKAVAGNNVYLFSEGAKKGAAALAFLDDRTIVMGSQAGVEATVANHAGSKAGLGTNAELLRLLEQVKPGSAFWMVGDQSLLANLPKAVPNPSGGGGSGSSVALPNLKSLLVTGELEGALSLSVTGETTDEAAAKNLADLVRGFAALLQMQAAQKPELKDLASAISVTTDGPRVLLSARFPYELLDALQPPARPSAGNAPVTP